MMSVGATAPTAIRVSRSAIADRQLCEQRRWWGYHAGGRGFSPVVEPTSLAIGNQVHDLMARVMGWVMAGGLPVAIPALIAHADAWVEPTDEQLLAFALALGWCHHRLPEILEEYEVVSAEEEWSWDLAEGLTLPLRMDAILRRRADGLLVTIDFKTVNAPNPDWAAKFATDLQTLFYTAALEDVMGEVGGIQYEGMVKGRRDLWKTGDDAGEHGYGSVLVSPYWDPKTSALTGVYRNGLTRRKLRSVEAVEKWVEVLRTSQPEVLANQFPTVPLFMPSKAVRDSVFPAIVRKEREFAARLAGATPTTFERTPSACLAFGKDHPCPMKELCWGGGGEDPLATGMFVVHVDHHAEEGGEA
jgi:hypothetical protein